MSVETLQVPGIEQQHNFNAVQQQAEMRKRLLEAQKEQQRQIAEIRQIGPIRPISPELQQGTIQPVEMQQGVVVVLPKEQQLVRAA